MSTEVIGSFMCPHNNYQCNIRTVNSSVVMEDGVTPPSSGSDVHVLDAVDNRSLHAHIVCRSSKYICLVHVYYHDNYERKHCDKCDSLHSSGRLSQFVCHQSMMCHSDLAMD